MAARVVKEERATSWRYGGLGGLPAATASSEEYWVRAWNFSFGAFSQNRKLPVLNSFFLF